MISLREIKFIFVGLFLITFYVCKNQGDLVEVNSTLINEHFSIREISELKKINTFFNQQICPNPSTEYLEDCYLDYLKRIKQETKKGNFKLDYNSSELFASLSENTFNNIWIYRDGKAKIKGTFPAKYEARTFLYYNPEGPYIEFLEEYTALERKPLLTQYLTYFKQSGSINANAVNELIENYTDLDYKEEFTRLFLVIHYLTLDFNAVKN